MTRYYKINDDDFEESEFMYTLATDLYLKTKDEGVGLLDAVEYIRTTKTQLDKVGYVLIGDKLYEVVKKVYDVTR